MKTKPDLDPIRLDADKRPKRQAFTPKLRAEALLKSGGRCTHCRAKIINGQFELDHILPVALGGTNEIGNLQALCSPCHKPKTKADIGRIRKADRQSKCLPRDPDEPKEPSRLQGPRFDKSKTRGFDGKVRERISKLGLADGERSEVRSEYND